MCARRGKHHKGQVHGQAHATVGVSSLQGGSRARRRTPRPDGSLRLAPIFRLLSLRRRADSARLGIWHRALASPWSGLSGAATAEISAERSRDSETHAVTARGLEPWSFEEIR
jgi:hypothetical protein